MVALWLVCSNVCLCNFSVASSSALCSSLMLTGDSVTLTSSIFKTSEVDVTVTSSTTDSTTSSHITQKHTVVYICSEGNTIPTPTVVYGTSGENTASNLPFDYTSSANQTQTVVYKKTSNSTGVVFSLQTLTPTEPNPG